MNEQINLGFKKLTKENWKLPDPMNKYFIKYNLYTGEKFQVSDEERVEEFLKIQLLPSVPIEVHRQFETARGAMLYGCYFYPLFTLGVDQLFRVAESAVTHKCLQHGLTKETTWYQTKLKKLEEAGYLTAKEHENWSYFREMRNGFSHSKTQMLEPPYETVAFLKEIANSIDKLFETP